MLPLLVVLAVAEPTSSNPLGPVADYLVGLGTVGIIITLSLWGKIWWWPGVNLLLEMIKSKDATIDRYARMYDDKVMPALGNATAAAGQTALVLEKVVAELGATHQKLDANQAAMDRMTAAFNAQSAIIQAQTVELARLRGPT